MGQWQLVGVLPHLPGDRAWDFDHIAFAPPTDPRIKEAARNSPAARALLKNFKYPFGYDCEPFGCIVFDGCPKRLRSWEALTDLRNAFAVAAVLHGAQHAVGSANIWFPHYSDYFEFYPVFPSQDGKGLICNGFAGSSYDDPKRFHGQASPDLVRGLLKVGVGDHLLPSLISEWKTKYATVRPQWKQISLFRSLAVAYRAARLPKGCDNLIFDIGIQASLWVSAHECLTHTGPGGRSDLDKVLALLGQARWRSQSLRIKRRQKERPRRLPKGQALPSPKTYVQHLYRRLYDARNDFLHGNPVDVKKAFLGPVTRDVLSIQVAPLIYSAALEAAFLTPSVPKRGRDLREVIRDALRFVPLERALLNTRKQRKRR
jgi:hypothetical protein